MVDIQYSRATSSTEGTTVSFEDATPAAEGFAMPAEWALHEACLMAWPSREALWDGRLDEAKRDYAAVARAVSDFEPVVMACNPGFAAEVRDLCGAAVEPLEVPINDSWARDSGPSNCAATSCGAVCDRSSEEVVSVLRNENRRLFVMDLQSELGLAGMLALGGGDEKQVGILIGDCKRWREDVA